MVLADLRGDRTRQGRRALRGQRPDVWGRRATSPTGAGGGLRGGFPLALRPGSTSWSNAGAHGLQAPRRTAPPTTGSGAPASTSSARSSSRGRPSVREARRRDRERLGITPSRPRRVASTPPRRPPSSRSPLGLARRGRRAASASTLVPARRDRHPIALGEPQHHPRGRRGRRRRGRRAPAEIARGSPLSSRRTRRRSSRAGDARRRRASTGSDPMDALLSESRLRAAVFFLVPASSGRRRAVIFPALPSASPASCGARSRPARRSRGRPRARFLALGLEFQLASDLLQQPNDLLPDREARGGGGDPHDSTSSCAASEERSRSGCRRRDPRRAGRPRAHRRRPSRAALVGSGRASAPDGPRALDRRPDEAHRRPLVVNLARSPPRSSPSGASARARCSPHRRADDHCSPAQRERRQAW